MKAIIKIFFILTIVSLFSCQKVIELELDESEIKFVIEGVMTNEIKPWRVIITRSKNFHEDNVFPKVSGALVTITDNGVTVPLTETSPGIYESSPMAGVPGHTYELAVSVNNQFFTATSVMPQPVKFDSLYVQPGPFGEFKFPYVIYTDPAAQDNGYRFVQYVNGIKDPAIFWADDEFSQGQQITMRLDNGVDKKDDPRVIETGDTVTVEMLGLDEQVLKFWYLLRTNGGNGQSSSAAPANPITNMRGGALGYFSAHTISRKSVIAP